MIKKIVDGAVEQSIYLSKIFADGRKKNGPLYLKKNIGLEFFFREINGRDIKYAVLMSFDSLTNIKADESICMIVKYEELDFVLRFFTPCKKSGEQKFNLYPDQFDEEINYNGLPYYPEILAKKILNNCVYYKGMFRVPNYEYLKKSLIFHLLFHKANCSLLPFEGVRKGGLCDDYYFRFLKDHINQWFFSLQDLYDFLYLESFLPNINMMKKYAAASKSKDLKEIVLMHEKKCNEYGVLDVNATMFIVGEVFLKYDSLYQELLEAISLEGLEVLSVIDEVDRHFMKNVCWCNWKKRNLSKKVESYQKIIIVFNEQPKWIVNEDGFVEDKQVKKVKDRISELLKRAVILKDHLSELHISNNLVETLEYISFLPKSNLDDIKLKIKAFIKNNALKENYEIVAELTRHGRRAYIYKIKYRGSFAVLKVFKSTYENFCNAEVEFHKFANKRELLVPKMLDYGENYLITEYIEGKTYNLRFRNIFLWDKRLIDKYLVFVDICFTNSYFNADFAFPNNILIKNDCCYFIDFEFVQKYQGEKIIKPYELIGVPKVYRGKYNLPHGYQEALSFYKIKIYLWMYVGKIYSFLSFK